ncbi:MAG: efflux RND transporter permease subunit [Bacteroidota bacterium]
MRLPNIALQNYLFVFTAIVLVVIISIGSFTGMPRSEDPFLSLPNYTIVVVYPGAGPEDMEERIVDPIEDVINELDDITEIRTEIANGLAVLEVEAEFGIDYDEVYDDLVSEVDNIRSELPEGIIQLDIDQFKPEDRVVVHQYALVSDVVPYNILKDFAEELEDDLEKLEGIKKVELEANPREEIRVELDFQKMANLGISLGQVIGTLQSNNINVPGGNLKSGNLGFNLKTSGTFDSLEDIQNVALSASQGQIVYLRDLATVKMAYEDPRWLARFNRKKTIFVTVTQKRGGNIIALSKSLEEASRAFKTGLPPAIQLETAFEQAPAVEARINDFLSNLLQGIILVGLIIVFFLGWRPALVVMIVIPLSIMVAIATLDFSGYALQQISIAALVIALGLLVDNAIVVIENIVRYKRMGFSLIQAASKGTGEVGYAIISSTATTVLAFAPLALLQSGPGEFLRTLPLTVIFVLIASLLFALTFTPIMASKVLEEKQPEHPPLAVRKMQSLIDDHYARVLKFALNKGWVVLLAGFGVLLGSLALFPSIGVSFFPTADKPLLLVNVDHPYSSNIDHTEKTLGFVESVLDTTDYVDSYITNAGHGNPQVYYNRIPEEYKTYHGEVVVNFKEWDPAKFYAALGQLRRAFDSYPDAKISFRELKNGAPFKAPIEILLIGEELDTLKRISYAIEAILQTTDGVLDVDNPLAIAKTDIDIEINRDKAAIYNVPLIDIDRTVRAGLNGLDIANVQLDRDEEEYPLVLRLPFERRANISDMEKIYVQNRTGDQVALNQLVDIKFEQDYAQINHFNMERNTAITANVEDPEATRLYTEAIIKRLDNFQWPEGYRYYVGGEYETQTESFGDLGSLLGISLILIFAVLVLQFKSITQPLIIFSAIPLAISGSFVALFLSGWSFSFFAFVGFISLIGIVVNNSIILVDYTNQLMEQGTEKLEAIETAAKLRFTPIVLTSLTTILGLMPLTFQGTSLWSPLGWTLIGGMISSTLLTLLVVPILYKWFTRKKETQLKMTK